MLKKIGLAALVALFAFVAYVASRPAGFQVERSIEVAAPAAVVFANVNDFHRWAAWSPWEKLDPGMARTYAGPATGVGAAYAWKSADGNVGEGRMTIVTSRPAEQVGVRLEFLAPFKAINDVAFTFTPTGAGTRVTWRMSGENGFFGKLFHVFMDMDAMVGGDFEKGLAALKAVSESPAK